MTTLVTDIAKNIDLSDSELNIIIQAYLNDIYYKGPAMTVAAWRVANYARLRRWAYPDPVDLSDAQVKINSGISELESQGEDQMDTYVQDCLDVKTRFPKS